MTFYINDEDGKSRLRHLDFKIFRMTKINLTTEFTWNRKKLLKYILRKKIPETMFFHENKYEDLTFQIAKKNKYSDLEISQAQWKPQKTLEYKKQKPSENVQYSIRTKRKMANRTNKLTRYLFQF